MIDNRVRATIQPLLGCIEDAAFIAEKNGNIILWNDPAAALFALEQQNNSEFRIQELAPFSDSWEQIQHDCEEASYWKGNVILQDDLQRPVIADCTLRVFTVPDEPAPLLLLIAKDVSDYRRIQDERNSFRNLAQNALSESESRYRLIAESVSDVIWTMDWDLNLTYISPSIETIWGYSREEIAHIPLRNIMTEASYRRAMNIYAAERQIESTGNADPDRNIVMNLEQYCKDGTIKWAETKAKILRDPSGNPIGLLGVTRDISDRINTQLKLMKSEQRYRRLAENAQDMIWRTDFAGNVKYVNPASKQIIGYHPDEIIGMTIFDYLTKESAQKAIEELKKCLLSENPLNSFQIELDYLHRDGYTVLCEVSATLIRGLDGNLIRMEGISRDITQRKKAEQILLDYEKKLEEQNYVLEQKNTALNEFMTQMKEEKKRLEEQIAANVDRIIMPVLSRMKEKGSDLDRVSLDMLEHNLKDMMSSFGMKISEKMSKLTQREIEICNMIKNGLTSKEIADILSISYRSVETHRNNIRKKLGINKKEVNLATYLHSL